MNVQSLLTQLLKSSGLAGGNAGSHVGKYATGAAAGSALTMLLGSRGGRRMGGSALKYGSAAALGAMAFKVYNDWQAAQQAQAAQAPAAAPPALKAVPSFASLPAPQVEQHSRVMLKAMIAAAKSDGHLDDRERELVQTELHRLEADSETHAWVDAELRRPLEPAEVAAAATSPEMAAEVYLASVLMVDQTTTMERAYLDALARELKLADSLKAQLEARASEA